MSRILVFRCDACGRKMKNEERAEGALMLPEERERLEAAPPTISSMFGGSSVKPKQERFDLCVECALALLVAFKIRKKEAIEGQLNLDN